MDFTYNEVFIQTLSFWNPDICSHEMAGCVPLTNQFYGVCMGGSSLSDTTVAGPPPPRVGVWIHTKTCMMLNPLQF